MFKKEHSLGELRVEATNCSTESPSELSSDLPLLSEAGSASELESSDTGLLRPGWASGREKSEDSPDSSSTVIRLTVVESSVESSPAPVVSGLSSSVGFSLCGVNGWLLLLLLP